MTRYTICSEYHCAISTMADYSSLDSGKAHNEVPEGKSTHRSDNQPEK
jgi:hypothetical protein